MGQFLPALLAFSGSKFCLVELPTAVSKSTVSHLFQEGVWPRLLQNPAIG